MKKKYKITLLIIAIIACVKIFFLLIMGLGIYKFNWENAFTNKVVKLLPYPAAIVDGHIIRYSKWQDTTKAYLANKQFYLEEQDVDLSSLNLPTDQEVKSQALEDLIKKQILESLTLEAGIKVSSSELDKAYKEVFLSKTKNGEESIEESLKQVYGLSVNEFKEQVIKEYLLRSKLEEVYKDSEGDFLQDLAKTRALDILDKIKKENQDFESLARTYSDDSLALSGGDVGYVGHNETIDFYDKIVWSLDSGEVSDIIETPPSYEQQKGYYIIKVEEIRDNEGEQEAKVRHIFIEADIDKLLDEKLQQANIWRWIKID